MSMLKTKISCKYIRPFYPLSAQIQPTLTLDDLTTDDLPKHWGSHFIKWCCGPERRWPPGPPSSLLACRGSRRTSSWPRRTSSWPGTSIGIKTQSHGEFQIFFSICIIYFVIFECCLRFNESKYETRSVHVSSTNTNSSDQKQRSNVSKHSFSVSIVCAVCTLLANTTQILDTRDHSSVRSQTNATFY